jgi:hypothetical protein
LTGPGTLITVLPAAIAAKGSSMAKHMIRRINYLLEDYETPGAKTGHSFIANCKLQSANCKVCTLAVCGDQITVTIF